MAGCLKPTSQHERKTEVLWCGPSSSNMPGIFLILQDMQILHVLKVRGQDMTLDTGLTLESHVTNTN